MAGWRSATDRKTPLEPPLGQDGEKSLDGIEIENRMTVLPAETSRSMALRKRMNS